MHFGFQIGAGSWLSWMETRPAMKGEPMGVLIWS